MNKGTKIVLVILGVLALGAGAYFIFKAKGDSGSDGNDTSDDNNNTNQNASDVKPFEKYVVNTKKGNLNLRESASTTSTIKQSLPKGTEILARESSQSGWHEVSDDGKKVIGFVSSQFILKK